MHSCRRAAAEIQSPKLKIQNLNFALCALSFPLLRSGFENLPYKYGRCASLPFVFGCERAFAHSRSSMVDPSTTEPQRSVLKRANTRMDTQEIEFTNGHQYHEYS
jgi:hypothetical protein